MYDTITLFQELGIFEGTMGYISAVIGFVLGIWLLLFSNAKIWKVAQDALPKPLKGIIVVGLVASIVYTWSKINPTNLEAFLKWTFIWAALALVCFILYFAIQRIFTYEKSIFDKNKGVKRKAIIGGLWILSSAKAKMKKKDVHNPQVLLDSGVSELSIWSKASIEMTKQIIMISFLGIIMCSVTAIAIMGFYMQTNVTQKAPVEIIREQQAADKKKQEEKERKEALKDSLDSIKKDTIPSTERDSTTIVVDSIPSTEKDSTTVVVDSIP